MKTSELEKGLIGELSWKHLCAKYQTEKTRLLARDDGLATSGDLNLTFDSKEIVVTGEQIKMLCQSVINNEIDPSDVQFLITAILLSGFDFENDDTEDVAHFLSTPNSETSLGLLEIQEAIQMVI